MKIKTDKVEYDFSVEELHSNEGPRGQCNRCNEMFPLFELSEPDEVSKYAVCESCYEILEENWWNNL